MPGPKRKDHTGKRFGRLVIIGISSIGNYGHQYVNARCDCGVEKKVQIGNLTSGRTVSCGCRRREAKGRTVTHGHTRGRFQTREYKSITCAYQRCYNPKADSFPYYGGRGIKFAAEWRTDRRAMLDYLGPRPPGTSIDRIDPDGDYAPGNVRWATASQQNLNKRRARNKS